MGDPSPNPPLVDAPDGGPIEGREVYRTAPFSMTLNDPYPRFEGHAIDAEYLRNVKEAYRHSFNGVGTRLLIGTYTRFRPTTVSFRMTLSDLDRMTLA